MTDAPGTIDISDARRVTIAAGLTSIGLAVVKITTGIAGNTYALIADGIESLTDVVASAAVLFGLTYSIKPPDAEHPYGHGKMETLSGLFVAFALIGAAALISWQSLAEIRTPHGSPEWFTLPVLCLVIVVKIAASRAVARTAQERGSDALEADAWHHASDAITSAAAFVGISIALVGGEGWATADDWAALLACTIILYNGLRLVWRGGQALLDASPATEVELKLREIAGGVPGVVAIEKMRVRRSGIGYLMDIHVEVSGELSVREGHAIGGAVKATLLASPLPVVDVTVHIEPAD